MLNSVQGSDLIIAGLLPELVMLRYPQSGKTQWAALKNC